MISKPVDTAIEMVVGPLIDDGDFKTVETGIAWNAAGMDVDLIQEKTNGTTVSTGITLTTTGGTNEWTHLGNGYYKVEITAAQNNQLGTAYLVGKCTGVLAFRSPAYQIVPTNNFDSLTKGSDNLSVKLGDVAHGGALSTLTLQNVVINNSSGVAMSITGTTAVIVQATDGEGVHVSCSGSNCSGLTVVGSGTGAGLVIGGGLDGPGAVIAGDSNRAGLEIYGGPSGPGLRCVGGDSGGAGIKAEGGSGGGPGIQVSVTSGIGIDIDGTTAGMTINASAGDALEVTSTGGDGDGAQFTGSGAGAGIKATAAAFGIHVASTAGDGMKVEGADWGRGLVVVGGASGHGVHIVSGGTAGDGLFIAAGGTGAGVTVQGGPSAGVGVQIDTTNGDGIDIASTGGVDIDANITGNITGNLSGNVAGNLGGALTTTERTAIADAYLDRADGIESGITPRKALRAIAAIVAGLIDTAQEDEELFKAIGAALNGTTRVTFEVDSEGNRNAVIFNL